MRGTAGRPASKPTSLRRPSPPSGVRCAPAAHRDVPDVPDVATDRRASRLRNGEQRRASREVGVLASTAHCTPHTAG
eukprot:6326052-Prymnesium_polylepis.2